MRARHIHVLLSGLHQSVPTPSRSRFRTASNARAGCPATRATPMLTHDDAGSAVDPPSSHRRAVHLLFGVPLSLSQLVLCAHADGR